HRRGSSRRHPADPHRRPRRSRRSGRHRDDHARGHPMTASTASTGHGENFSLEHYLDASAHTFQQRFDDFRPFVTRSRATGFVLREITGPAGPVVRVRDPGGSEIRELIMFGSNNYLGLADEPEIIEAAVAATREFGVGCGGPPLLNGTTSLHTRLEERLAESKGCESALLFSSGYAA